MTYRKFKADYLFNGYDILKGDQVLITDSGGRIEEIVEDSDAGENVEVYEGILSPGLVNCHCHLELSHLKNVIPPHTGLVEFLCSVVTKRDFEQEVIQEAIVNAEAEMYKNGIVAVGDIGNTSDTALAKMSSSLYWHNFVEVLGFTDARAAENVQHYQEVMSRLGGSKQRSSIVPHAPYSISPRTFQLINEATSGQVISMHNQEHPAENVLYETGGGEYLRLFKIFGIEESPFPVTGKTSLQSCLTHFNKEQTLLLVHNTCMKEEDLLFAGKYASTAGIKIIYCLCPNANLYIENKLPSVEMFIRFGCPIVLGTDSYSSNWQLSIIKEAATIHKHFPEIALNVILQWATINGARALNLDAELGSFEKGKTPGIVLIEEGLQQSKRIL